MPVHRWLSPNLKKKVSNFGSAAPVGGKQVHNANIVATMLAHGIPRLFTHNVADFNRFSTLIEILPLVEASKHGE
jgi:hypothetical protein